MDSNGFVIRMKFLWPFAEVCEEMFASYRLSFRIAAVKKAVIDLLNMVEYRFYPLVDRRLVDSQALCDRHLIHSGNEVA